MFSPDGTRVKDKTSKRMSIVLNSANLDDGAVFSQSQAPKRELPKMRNMSLVEGGGAPLLSLK